MNIGRIIPLKIQQTLLVPAMTRLGLLVLTILSISNVALARRGPDSLLSNPLHKVSIPKALHLSADNKGNIFVADQNGNVFKYDSLGNETFHFSPNQPATPKILDASGTSRILLFFEDRQEYLFLDWLLSPISINQFDMDEFGYVSIVGQSANNMIWIVDNVQFTLVKYDIRNRAKLVETNLETLIEGELHPLWIKEYGNFVYISTERNGVLVFDNLGNYKKKLPFNQLEHFDISSSKLYWTPDNGTIRQFDLLNFNVTEQNYGLPGQVLFVKNHIFQLFNNELLIYSKPKK